jgi:hypothetical protein
METKELKNAPVSERVKMLLEVYADLNAAAKKVDDIAGTVFTGEDHDDATEPFLLAIDNAHRELSRFIGLYVYDGFTSSSAVV